MCYVMIMPELCLIKFNIMSQLAKYPKAKENTTLLDLSVEMMKDKKSVTFTVKTTMYQRDQKKFSAAHAGGLRPQIKVQKYRAAQVTTYNKIKKLIIC